MKGPVVAPDGWRNPSGPVLTFTPSQWRAFLGGVRNAGFDV
jgi:hypothetical protein